jgi:hypothetical protein
LSVALLPRGRSLCAAGGHARIGVLDINSAETDARNLAAFRDALQHLG